MIGDLFLLTRDLIGNRETIGGEMCKTKIIKYSTLLIVDDNSNMIVLNAEKGPAGVVYQSIGSGKYDIGWK